MNGRWILIWTALFIIAETSACIMGASNDDMWGIAVIFIFVIGSFLALWMIDHD